MTLVAIKEDPLILPSWVEEGQGDGFTGPEWLQQRRKAAWMTVQERGLPTSKDEEWRKLSLSKLSDMAFASVKGVADLPTEQVLAKLDIPESHRMVFVDGQYNPSLSRLEKLPEQVQLLPLSDAISSNHNLLAAHLGTHVDWERHPFAALNLARFDEGVLCAIPARVEVKEPIQLIFVATVRDQAQIFHPRLLIHLGEGARVQVVETHMGPEQACYFSNTVTEVVLEGGSELQYDKRQYDSDAATHLSVTQVQQGRDSQFYSRAIHMGARLARQDLDVSLAGEGCFCQLDGLYVANGMQQSAHFIYVDHQKPHGTSRQGFKGILDDKAKGIFSGKVVVRAGAIKSDADQTARSLLLSREAEADPKPALEIYNDDVKCSHGATVGQLDADALFYLRSRGIDGSEARRILTLAFAEDVLKQIKLESVRQECMERLASKLSEAGKEFP